MAAVALVAAVLAMGWAVLASLRGLRPVLAVGCGVLAGQGFVQVQDRQRAAGERGTEKQDFGHVLEERAGPAGEAFRVLGQIMGGGLHVPQLVRRGRRCPHPLRPMVGRHTLLPPGMGPQSSATANEAQGCKAGQRQEAL